jgi:hypothetical protein
MEGVSVMKEIDVNRYYFCYLLIAALIISVNLAVDGDGPQYRAVSTRPGTELDKIFSSTSTYGLLGEDRNI